MAENESDSGIFTCRLAYLAGIFDAGASFQVRQRRQRRTFYAVRLTISVPGPATAQLLQDTFGGKLEFATPTHRTTAKVAWYDRRQIAQALETLLPYLYAQKERSQAMLDFIDCPCDEHMERVMASVDPWKKIGARR